MQLKIKGVPVGPGTEMSIKGERGRFRFLYPSWSKNGKMALNFFGGPPGRECFRAFYPEQVKKVHRKPDLRSRDRLASA